MPQPSRKPTRQQQIPLRRFDEKTAWELLEKLRLAKENAKKLDEARGLPPEHRNRLINI